MLKHLKSFLFCTTILTTLTTLTTQANEPHSKEDAATASVGQKTSPSNGSQENSALFSLSNSDLSLSIKLQQQVQQELRRVAIETIEVNQKNLQTMISALKLIELDGQKSKEVNIEAILNTYIHTQFIEHYKGQIIKEHLHKIIGRELQAMLPTGGTVYYIWKDSDVTNFSRVLKNVELENWPNNSVTLRKLFTDKNISPNITDVMHGVLFNERQGTCNMYVQLAPILNPLKSLLEAEEVKLKTRLLG